MGADAGNDLLARRDVGGGGAIRAITGDRVKGVGDSEDAGVDVNLFATQTPRVAAAVIFFMVLADDRSGAPQEIDAIDDPQAVVDVLAHLDPFVIRERPRLEQD